MMLFALTTLSLGLMCILIAPTYRSKTKSFRWSLGADFVVDYSSSVRVTNQQLTIKGWQNPPPNHSIHYSVIKIKWFIFPIYLDSCLIKEAYTKEQPFSHTFHHLPNDEDYYIEVYSFGQKSNGELIIGQEPQGAITEK